MEKMRKTICLIGFILIGATVHAQEKEGHLSAVSRNLEIFNDLYKQLELFYVDTLNADTVMQWCIDGMLSKVDPYTGYYPLNNEELRTMSTGKYAGIGSVVRFHKKEDRVVISEPYWDSPSQKAGVKAGDIILAIDKKDVKGMPVDKVSNMLRGEAGTTFELKVQRPGVKKPLSFKITRETIKVPQVPYYGMLKPGIGYICLSGFADGASREMKQALIELKKQGADRMVLDLRDNPGGSLDESVDIANLFIPKGKKVVFTKGKHEQGFLYSRRAGRLRYATCCDGGRGHSLFCGNCKRKSSGYGPCDSHRSTHFWQRICPDDTRTPLWRQPENHNQQILHSQRTLHTGS